MTRSVCTYCRKPVRSRWTISVPLPGLTITIVTCDRLWCRVMRAVKPEPEAVSRYMRRWEQVCDLAAARGNDKSGGAE